MVIVMIIIIMRRCPMGTYLNHGDRNVAVTPSRCVVACQLDGLPAQPQVRRAGGGGAGAGRARAGHRRHGCPQGASSGRAGMLVLMMIGRSSLWHDDVGYDHLAISIW
jgi:hypothetical protein